MRVFGKIPVQTSGNPKTCTCIYSRRDFPFMFFKMSVCRAHPLAFMQRCHISITTAQYIGSPDVSHLGQSKLSSNLALFHSKSRAADMPHSPLRNPWSDEAPVPPFTLSDESIWPHRLLHVPTMTSHKRQGDSVYNNVNEPRYNVLSYTWGRWRKGKDTFPSIEIHGVPWTVPCVDPGAAFNRAHFKHAIEQAARGVQKPACDWVWVDIACIPQMEPEDHGVERIYDGEDLKAVAAQEVGRQVAIFHRAEESFVWLWGLTKSTLQDDGSQPRVEDLEGYVLGLGAGAIDLSMPDQLPPREQRAEIEQRFNYAANSLIGLDETSRSFASWITKIMEHQWCGSLWTLQEMVLRRDAWILFDDELLELDQGQEKAFPLRFSSSMMRDLPRTRAMTTNEAGKWSLADIKFELWLLGSLLDTSSNFMSQTWERITKIEEALKTWLVQDPGNQLPSVARIRDRLLRTLELMRLKGMDALHVSFPHTAYSAAQDRETSRPLDRIYGIVQTYGIACVSDPEGNTVAEKVEALEDDFGTKLVSKMPVLSQLFIHSLNGRVEGNQVQHPRRSWLITTKCKVDDHWWESFEAGNKIVNHFDSFQATNDRGNLFLKFEGRAWDLDSFVQEPPQSELWARTQLFTPVTAEQNPSSYNGLMLDNHVSMTVLGRRIDYFSSFEEMSGAVGALTSYYGKGLKAKGTTKLRVLSLGCSFTDDLPHVYHVGLVIAPTPTVQRAADDETRREGKWYRIGLMRWIEEYPQERMLEKHPDLPQAYEFSCLID